MTDDAPRRPDAEGVARVRHKAANVDMDGRVSALCFRRLRPIDLRKASWTMRWEAVTCPKCIALANAPSAGGLVGAPHAD
jgi:hypothetical protein